MQRLFNGPDYYSNAIEDELESPIDAINRKVWGVMGYL
ncbi:hypothetical protein EBME_0567 [bacterium endosymbiont of Mortierella elongata FMR23-6]|nr:hypothetical protein EBME_0567 [bacterium endosymbiont of Mortierella elongata FMR23-6]